MVPNTLEKNKSTKELSALQALLLSRIASIDKGLEVQFEDKIKIQPSLSRSLVSFQANKVRPFHRWYKYKEAFSSSLVEYLFQKYTVNKGTILDPFAGSGTALFAAKAMGLNAHGIEILPICQQIIKTKLLLQSNLTSHDVERLRFWATFRPWKNAENLVPINELRITKHAYSIETELSIQRYRGALKKEVESVQTVLEFCMFCVLESVSYTRKDGQYLRWDYRSGRQHGKKQFDKGTILNFDEAIVDKINEIITDSLFPPDQSDLFVEQKPLGEIKLFAGSCLEVMPSLPEKSYSAIMTSPPYCNRYDYTRTYALELALMGINEKELIKLRQNMLSCTVENRSKDLLSMNPSWRYPLLLADEQELLQAILAYLDDLHKHHKLNNTGIPRMVKGYFYEMACVIWECSRLLKPHSFMFMVNDNVRYAGASVSVDMILSDFAQHMGFSVESILVLPNGKGNSSQQMGLHGRNPLRKCVYVWRKK